MAKWLPPNGFTCTVHHLDAKVGGTFKMSFRNFTTGASHSFGGKYLELVPGERLRYTDKFDDPNLPGEMQVTVNSRRCRSAPTSASCRRAFPTSFRRRPAISAGRSRCEISPASSSPKSINSWPAQRGPRRGLSAEARSAKADAPSPRGFSVCKAWARFA